MLNGLDLTEIRSFWNNDIEYVAFMIERTFILVLSNLLVAILLFFSLRPAIKGHFNERNLVWIFPVLVLFCLFSFWGTDWFHYYESYYFLKGTNADLFNLEPIYEGILDWSPNYIIFRLAIWGSALVLTFLAFRVLNLDMGVASFYFVICSLLWFSYGRVSLTFALSFFGFSLIVSSRKRVILFILGCVCVLSSLLFHKSAIYIVSLIILSVIIYKLPRKSLKLLLFAFPIFLLIVPTLLGNFFSMTIEDENDFFQTVTKGQYYLSGDNGGLHFGSLGKFISKILEWLPKYILAYMTLKIVDEDNGEMPKPILLCCILFYLIMYTASFFIFDLGYSTSAIFSRFQRFAILPEIVVMTYLFSSGQTSKLFKRTQILFILSTFYVLTYQVYSFL